MFKYISLVLHVRKKQSQLLHLVEVTLHTVIVMVVVACKNLGKVHLKELYCTASKH